MGAGLADDSKCRLGPIRILSGWKARPEESDFYQATPADRWRFGAAYLGLAAFLALGYYGLHAHLLALPRPVA